MTNLALSLLDTAARLPGHPAILLDDHVMTYAELDDASARVAASSPAWAWHRVIGSA